MSKIDLVQFRQSVYDIVRQIPYGQVLTYGDVARLAGWPCHSRLVGHVLASVTSSQNLPCHRVVNASGRLAPGWHEQAEKLSAEGISVMRKKDGKMYVPLKNCRWQIFDTLN